MLSEQVRKVLSAMPDNGHHILSPSGWSGWSKCTGMMRDLDVARATSQDNVASVEGTLGHYLLEICITLWVSPLVLKQTPENFIDDGIKWYKKITENKNNTEEVKKFAQKCFQELSECTFSVEMRTEIEKCYQRLLAYKQDGWTILPESKVSLEAYFGHKHCDGTCDIVMYKGNRVIIADLKYGKGIEVDPVNNGQLQLYCGGVCSLLYGMGITVDQIDLVIMQPRISNGVWKVWSTNYSELYKFLEFAKDKSIDALLVLGGQNPEKYFPSEKSCQWCHRKLNCKARLEFAFDSVKQMFLDAGVVEGVPVSPTDISTEVLSSILLRSPFIIAFLNDMDKEAKNRARKGIKVPKYKMVKGRSTRSWKEKNSDALLSLFSVMGLKELDCQKITLNSPAQMDKVKMTKEQKDCMKGLTQFAYGANVLVPETDNRPEVLDAVAQFKEAGIGI